MKITPMCLLHSKMDSADSAISILNNRLACGFPSPADDYLESLPSIDELLIKHPSATYLGRASGDSMIERGILDGSILVIDRAIEPIHNSTIVASIAGEFTVKIVDLKTKQLKAANPNHAPIPIPEDLDVTNEGVVTYVITPQQVAFAI